MQNDPQAAIKEISRDVSSLAGPLRHKNWKPIKEYLSTAQVYIKGTPRDMVCLERVVNAQTAAVRDLHLLVESLLYSNVAQERVELAVRVAVVGRRIEGAAVDGIIMDCRLVFVLRNGRWSARELQVDCPPEWAQWNSRPNSRAPIHYGDPTWWHHWAG